MKSLLKLALPTSGMFLGLMLMGFVDLLFVGKLGAAPLGGLGLGNSIFSWVMTIGLGLIFGLDYPTSHAIGAGDHRKAFRIFAQGLHLAYLMTIPAVILVLMMGGMLGRFGLNPEAVPFARTYLMMTAVSFLPIFLFNAGKSYLQAQGIALPTFLVLVVANLLNIFLCAALIEGRFGFPNYGFEGLPYATVISRFFMGFTLVAYVFWRELKIGEKLRLKFDPVILREIMKLGVPASLHMLLEVGVFSLATALAAKFTAVDLAAHQIVLNTASILFMVPLGIGSAAGSLVGRARGAGDAELMRKTGNSALWLGLGFAGVASTLLILFSDVALGIYTHDQGVIEAAKKILFIAALFQVSDGVQVIAAGALRGMGNTVWAAIANGVGHWIVGLPLGLLLAFSYAFGIAGIWTGLATGLTFVAVVLAMIWRRESRRLLSNSLFRGSRA